MISLLPWPLCHISVDMLLKEGLQLLLRIGSAHNIGGLHNLEIAQISHV